MVEKRVYQVWKGSNIFFLSGRLIFGPDVRSLLVTIVLIIVPAVIFYVFVARHLIDRLSSDAAGIAVLVVAVVFTIHVLILLLFTSGRDPGIIPRSPHPPEPEEYSDSAVASPIEWSGGQTPRLRLPRTKDVLVNGIPVRVKYCDTCMLYRPPRCSHCSICNNCVERFDHHCPWVGQCIGQRNYRFFFMFVFSTTLLCIYVFTFCALYIKFLMEGDLSASGVKKSRTVWEAMGKSPASVVLMIYTFIAVWFVGGLTLFHLYLISTNQTTYENFRYRYDNRVNPYNLGLLHNFAQIFCSRIEHSKNNFRAKVQVDASGRIILSPEPVIPPARSEIDPGLGGKPARQTGESDGNEASQKRDSGIGHVGLEVKENYEEAFTPAGNFPLSMEGSNTRAHPRRSSWGRKSGSWEMMPEILAMASGRPEQLDGDNTPPRGRVHENIQDPGS